MVVLVGDDGEDASRFAVDEVRAYLARIDVPLFVAGWHEAEALSELWGPTAADLRPPTRRGEALPGAVDAVDALDPLEAAAEDWRRALEQQAVVWVKGRHPVHEIRATPRAIGVRRAVELSTPEVASAEVATAEITTAEVASIERITTGGHR